MTNVNIELFERTSPVKRIETVRNLTQVELAGISEETILRIVKRQDGELKEAGNMNSM